MTSASAQSLTSLVIKLKTGDRDWAGTDDTVRFHVKRKSNRTEPLTWVLDNPLIEDEFEVGETEYFTFTNNLPYDLCDIESFWIEKEEDGWSGGWYLSSVQVSYNGAGQHIYSNTSVGRWLEDNSLTWAPSDFVSVECPPPPPPMPDCPRPSSGGNQVALWAPDSGQLTVLPGSGDSDRDCYPDDVEEHCGTDPNNPDTDDDGIPDGFEDVNRDCAVDAEETDPRNADSNGDGTLDGEYDLDGDGLVDWIDPGSDTSDFDGDGWEDGPTNVRTYLELFSVICVGESYGSGDDDPFVVIDDVRFPKDVESLDGYFQLSSGEEINPMIDVLRRAHSPSQTADYRTTVELWDDDWFDFTDDNWWKEELRFGDQGTFVLNLEDDGLHYILTFKAHREYFYDPNPAFGTSDSDADGILDHEEHLLSERYGGLGDPGRPDIFIQLNWLGENNGPEPYAKIDFASQFHYHGLPIHLDDGDFAYGREVPFSDETTMVDAEQYATAYLPRERHGVFHYMIGVDDVVDEWGEGKLGLAQGPTLNDDGRLVQTRTDWRVGLMIFEFDVFYLDILTDYQSILLMHEFGHALGLCHRPGDDGVNSLVAPPVCVGPNPPGDCTDCSHYWVDSDSDTAMGNSGASDISDNTSREINYEAAEWEALNLRGIRCWPRTPPQGTTIPPQFPTGNGGNLCWPQGLPP